MALITSGGVDEQDPQPKGFCPCWRSCRMKELQARALIKMTGVHGESPLQRNLCLIHFIQRFRLRYCQV